MLRAEAIAWRANGLAILQDIDVALQPGELVAIVGPNGAGKSSLLRLLAGGARPDSGRVVLDDMPLDAIPLQQLAARRAVLAQDNAAAFPFLVRDIVATGAGIGSAREEAIQRCLAMVDAVRLIDRGIQSLSGGERQRVQVARVLMQLLPRLDAGESGYLLLDEPLNALDLRHQLTLLETLRDLLPLRCGICCVMHDLVLAHRYADRVWVLSAGRKVADGHPHAIIGSDLLTTVFGLSQAHGEFVAQQLGGGGARAPEWRMSRTVASRRRYRSRKKSSGDNSL